MRRSVERVSNSMRLHKLHSHLWHIQATSAWSALGLEEGLQWLMNNIDDMRTGGI